jgi:molybdopterin/thiamine biosynthesis adenylyltransferase
MNRYARQMMVPDVGAGGQARLARSHVLVVGAGGLGCPVLQYLAGAGVGRITLIDPDDVEESNLHRQPLYRMCDLGHPKAYAAQGALQEINPGVTVDALAEALDPSNAPALVDRADLVVDAADSYAASYTLSDTCRDAGTPLISASVLGQSGYVGGFCGRAPSLRAVFPDLPEVGASCATAGVIGPVVGAVGAMQAQMALRVLLGSNPSPLGQMVTVDLADFRFGSFSFLDSPEPDHAPPFLSKTMLRDSDRVIELRGVDEADRPIVPTAIRMTMDALRTLSPEPDRRIVLCCSTGLRAWRAASLLRTKDHSDLALLAAGPCA